MKDRVPKFPGRVTMTPVPGQANTYDMVRADQPVEVGDALNKANLLPDDVVAYLGLKQSNPQPKDAFTNNAVRVGDIKTTVRTNLGNDWLLCNGDSFDEAEYPDLAESITPIEKACQFSTIAIQAVSVAYGNGLWVAVGYTLSEGYPYVFTATNPYGNWTGNKISTSKLLLQSVAYGNGLWVASGKDSSNRLIVLYASDPSGTWISSQRSTMTSDRSSIAYGNGMWVVAYADSDYNPAIVYFSNPASMSGRSLSSTTLTASSNCQISIAYGDNKFVFIGGEKSIDPKTFFGVIESPSSGFVKSGYVSSTQSYAKSVSYGDGTWCVAANLVSGNAPIFFYTTDLTTWHENTISGSSDSIGGIAYSNGTWVSVGNNSRIMISENPSATWTLNTVGDGSAMLKSVFANGETWTAVGYTTTDTIPTAVTHQRFLPEISPIGAYAFIRGR